MKVLVIPDLHCPFEHPDAVSFLKWVKGKHRPDKIVCLGDEADFYAISDYDHEPEAMSADSELLSCIEHLQPIYKLFPDVEVCTSNHTIRPFKRAMRSNLPQRLLRSYSEILEAPKGWRWADFFIHDGVRYEHGEGQSGAQGALKAAQAYMQSTVIGHLHAFAGILFYCSPTRSIFGFNAGWLGDEARYAFRYGKHQKAKGVLGCGMVVDGVPEFIPMRLNAKGRWIKRA